jgi:hypothetical protein
VNHNVFASSLGRQYAVDPRRPQGRSSSLRCGRSTLTPGCGPPRASTGRNEDKQPKQPTDPTFTGVPNTDKEDRVTGPDPDGPLSSSQVGPIGQ